MAKIEDSPIKVNEQNNPPEIIQKEGKGFGHHFKVIREKVQTFIVDAFRALAKVFNERSPLGKVYKLSINVLTGIGHAVGSNFRGAGLLKALGIVDNFNDCLDFVEDTDHFIHARFNDKHGKVANRWEFAARIALLIADVGGIVLWLNDLTFISLSKASAAIGKGFSKLASALGPTFNRAINGVVKTLPFVAKVAAKVTLLNVIRSVVGFAFIALAANECRKIYTAIKERNWKEAANCSLNLISYAAEVALKALAIVSCTCIPGLVAVGCVAAGFGLASFIMKAVREYQEERAEEQSNRVAAQAA
ncbi:MAG: hypothetical protein HWD61_13830 [Parachlamydiaceae bacterium]|nr:MAG: hypothetical protein HWD61_13830 [Parachlamydiaceae bacterium]